MESEQHKQKVTEVVERLSNEGYKIVNLGRKRPDAIAVKDGQIVAIEILGKTRTKRGIRHNWTYKNKLKDYSRFDKVIIEEFIYGEE